MTNTTESDKNRKAEEYVEVNLRHCHRCMDLVLDNELCSWCEEWEKGFKAGYEAGQKDWAPVVELVSEQAEDVALWSVPALGLPSIVEAYLQQELRKLHALIENIQPPKEVKNE